MDPGVQGYFPAADGLGGILTQYPKAAEAGDYFAREDFVGYRETFDQFDRHKKWVEVLERYQIPYLEHTMVTDVLLAESRVSGVMGFHVPSGQIIVISAKAVVLTTGGGSYKPTGYPTGGDMALENADDYAKTKCNIMVLGRVKKAVYGVPAADGSEIQDVAQAAYTRRGGSRSYETDPEEQCSGKMSTPVAASALGGAATGMCCHLTSGVFCGLEELDGATGIPGLYAAGDGIHATAPSGAAYPCGVGFTSCFTSIDGDHAGKAAAAYAASAPAAELDGETVWAKTAEITAPLSVEQGFDANWARGVLHSIMAPYWISTAKTEETLRAAL